MLILAMFVISAALSLGGTTSPARAAQPDSQVNLIRECLEGTATLPRTPVRAVYLVPTFTLTPYGSFGTYGSPHHSGSSLNLGVGFGFGY